jgi:hypothetical protein
MTHLQTFYLRVETFQETKFSFKEDNNDNNDTAKLCFAVPRDRPHVGDWDATHRLIKWTCGTLYTFSEDLGQSPFQRNARLSLALIPKKNMSPIYHLSKHYALDFSPVTLTDSDQNGLSW